MKSKERSLTGDKIAAYKWVCVDKPGAMMNIRWPQIKCITMCYTFARQNIAAFRDALRLSAKLCSTAGIAVPEKLLSGLFYIATTIGLDDSRLCQRVVDVGSRRLLEGATRAAAFYVRGGPKVFAEGMIQEINKGLRNRFELPSATNDA